MRLRPFVIAAVAFFVMGSVVIAGSIDINNPPQGTFLDEWMVLEFSGAKIGHAHNIYAREGDTIATRMTMTMTFGRAGQEIKISTTESSKETIAGVPLSFDTVMAASFQQISQQGTIRDGQVKLQTSQSGIHSERTFPYPEGALMSWGLFRKQMEMGFDIGTQYPVKTYSPSQMADTALEGTFEVIGKEEVDIGGKKVPATKVSQTLTMPAMGSLLMHAWLDEQGSTIQAEIPFAGMGVIRMVRSDEATALKVSDPPEFFMQTLIEADKPIDRKAAKSIRYRLSLKDKKKVMQALPWTGLQTPGDVTGNSVELTVTRQDHAALRNSKPAPIPGEFKEFLSANTMMNLDDPELRKMADVAAGNEATPYDLADKLRKYVTDAITSKTLNVGFGSATEVCRTKEGDCSEHAVLLAALGRIKGLPSRVVTGLVYVPTFNDADHVFGFHMWTQFYIGGQWVDFDAAQRESDCNPTHIAINVSSLGSGSLVEAAFSLMNILGQLEIEVLEVTT